MRNPASKYVGAAESFWLMGRHNPDFRSSFSAERRVGGKKSPTSWSKLGSQLARSTPSVPTVPARGSMVTLIGADGNNKERRPVMESPGLLSQHEIPTSHNVEAEARDSSG
jgi:hypothetical protein